MISTGNVAAAKRNGILVMVHAENGDAADLLQQQLVADGKLAPKYHATGMVAMLIARPASHSTITFLRSQRSISAPTGRLKKR